MAQAKKKTPAKILIRRAIAEDVVNIFKLVQRQREQAGSTTPVNTHGAIAYTLDFIKGGHVIVADYSGRLVGVLGCEILEGRDRTVYDVGMFAMERGFEDSGVDKALMRNLCAFVKKQNYILKVMVSSAQVERAGLLVKQDDFKVAGTVYELNGDGAEEEPATDEPVATLEQFQKPEAPWLPAGDAAPVESEQEKDPST